MLGTNTVTKILIYAPGKETLGPIAMLKGVTTNINTTEGSKSVRSCSGEYEEKIERMFHIQMRYEKESKK